MAGTTNEFTFFAIDYVADMYAFVLESVVKLFDATGMWAIYIAAIGAIMAFFFLIAPMLPNYFGQAITRFNDFADWRDGEYSTVIDVPPTSDPSRTLESGD